MIDEIHHELEQFKKVFDLFQESNQLHKIEQAAKIMAESLKIGGKIISCGNGGSYSDAQHFASELTGKYRLARMPYSAIALSDGGAMSCIANDFGYHEVFKRQVEAIGRHGDVLLCLSTSGNSQNVVNAANAAESIGMKVIAITGADGGLLNGVDVNIAIPHSGTADRIQECGLIVLHILVKLIETA